MKRFVNKILVGAGAAITLLAGVTGCTRELDQYTKTQITDPVFWKSTNDLITATNYLYTSLPNFTTPLEDAYSDFTLSTSSSAVINPISDGSRVPQGTDIRWNDAYKFIRAANNIMEKAQNIPGDPAAIANCVAQARFFRALNYFNLLKAYGDVPYIDRTIAADDVLLYTPRTDRRIVVDSIYADLDFAAAHCPQADEIAATTAASAEPNKEYGRITRSAALAFKSRVALYEGSWQKFQLWPAITGPKDPAKHFSIAKEAARTVMTEGKHNLFVSDGDLSFQTLFRYPGETYANNKENILARIYGESIQNNISSHNYMRAQLTDGGNASSRAFVTLALYADGLPAGKSPFDRNGSEEGLLTDYENRDPRMVLSLFKVGDPFVSISNPMAKYGNTFHYHQQKYWTGPQDFFNAAAGGVFIDFIVIRYAEVLLNYAEATYELNNSISDDDLNLSINLLRKRATNNDATKLALLTNAFVAANGLSMRTEIRRERSIELAFEGFRYWDLLRWKTAETELPKPLLGRKYFTNISYGSGVNPPPLLNGYNQYQAANRRRFDPQKDYLWPLPTVQIGLSRGTLKQNPNW
ncbi:MAG: RagB/SusD family nutrient uptake outer membrane protein [Niabella sp.]